MNISKQLNILISLSRNQNYNEVIKTCKQIIKIDSKIPEVFNFYGLALQGQGKNNLAIKCFNEAILIHPKDFSAHNNLANSYKLKNNNELAEKNFEKCLDLNPNYFPALINFAVLKKKLNEYNDAINLFNKALAIKPNLSDNKILYSLSELFQQKGDFKQAKKIIYQILSKNKDDTKAHYMLGKYINYKNEDKHHLEMEALLKNEDLSIDEVINLSFALGKAYEEKQDFKRSFDFYNNANSKKNGLIKYDFSYLNNLKKEIIDFFEKFDHSLIKDNYSSKKIIFICGMPRSGTTLIEQILSSHKDVQASGENSFLFKVLKKNFFNNLKLNNTEIINTFLSKNQFIQQQFFELLKSININSNIITDKTVQNFLWIGFIKLFFPNSIIINCTRNPKDTCLSIYKNSFQNSFMNWSYTQKNIADFYNFYLDLMNYWQNKFPNNIYDIKYESILNNPNEEIKKLIDICNLSWDPNCLSFYENKNPVKTASSIQVRKPLYKSSVNSGEHYSIYLSEMYNMLKI